MANKRKRGNPVREWFSDNLRYIILILLIAAIVLGVFFVVKNVRERSGSGEADRGATTSSTSVTPAQEEPTVTPAPTQEPTVSPTPTATPTPRPTPEGHYLSDTDADASMGVQDYFQQLLESPDNTAVENYSRFTVLTTPGAEEGDVVALASYLVKYRDFAEEVPSLTDFYLTKDESGNYVLVDELTPEQERYRNEVSLDADAQALIKNVRTELEEVLAGDPELKAFIEGLG